ncbi:MAG: PAS domain-containing protein [Gammaproteobacteria bacterium]|nr:PAS domain-containing protein [Gammaproteobacteria bacterium]
MAKKTLPSIDRFLQAITDAVVVTDASGRVLHLNPAAHTLTGWSVDEAIGQPAATVVTTLSAPQHSANCAAPLEAVLASGHASEHSDILLTDRGGGQTAPCARRGGRYQPAESRPGDHRATRLLRPAHQAPQPPPVVRSGAAGSRRRQAIRRLRRAAVHRPGSLQAHQRQSRPPCRRPDPDRSGRAPAGIDPGSGHHRPPRRRRVRGGAARGSQSGRHPARRLPGTGAAIRQLRDRGPPVSPCPPVSVSPCFPPTGTTRRSCCTAPTPPCIRPKRRVAARYLSISPRCKTRRTSASPSNAGCARRSSTTSWSSIISPRCWMAAGLSAPKPCCAGTTRSAD